MYMERWIPFSAAVALATLSNTELAATAVVGTVSRYSFLQETVVNTTVANPTIKEDILILIFMDFDIINSRLRQCSSHGQVYIPQKLHRRKIASDSCHCAW